jgi:hypothetical protein
MKLLQRRKENWDNDFVLNILLLPYEIDTGTLCLLQILQTRLGNLSSVYHYTILTYNEASK